MSGAWQPIETAPKDGTPVDLWLQYFNRGNPTGWARLCDYQWREGAWVARCGFDDDEVEWTDSIGQEAKVTHWMPIPVPPTERTVEAAGA